MENESQNTTSSDPLEQRVASLEGKNTYILILTLCIFTILGSVFGMFRGIFYMGVAEVAQNEIYQRGVGYIVLNAGTLTGAIIMLCRSMAGLYLYTISQSLYIVLVLYTTYVTYGKESIVGFFAFFIGPMFWLPSLAFLIVYWVTSARKCLK